MEALRLTWPECKADEQFNGLRQRTGDIFKSAQSKASENINNLSLSAPFIQLYPIARLKLRVRPQESAAPEA